MSEQQEESVSQGVQAGGLSILGAMKERRQQVLAAQVLRLPVPRWTDPVVVVQYKPVDHKFIRAGQDRVQAAPKGKKAETEVDVNCDLLIRGCTGVLAIIDGEEYSLRPDDPEGEPTLFDGDLAECLGLEGTPTARQVVRGLFITEPDILSAAESLIRWSGYKNTEADETISGE